MRSLLESLKREEIKKEQTITKQNKYHIQFHRRTNKEKLQQRSLVKLRGAETSLTRAKHRPLILIKLLITNKSSDNIGALYHKEVHDGTDHRDR